MGIRSKDGGFFLVPQNQKESSGSFKLERDLGHPYYGGSVFPEVVVFDLSP